MMGFTLLCEAIRQRKQVNFIYKSTRWTVEPHLLGYTAHGDTVLNGWVLTSREATGWLQFHVPVISNVSLLKNMILRARPDYDPYDTSIAQVICRLENIRAFNS